jgi:hypothetical protein
VRVATDDVLSQLRRNGYYITRVMVDDAEAVQFVLGIAHALGELYVPKGCDPAEPVIRTASSRARRAAPFDRPDAIGWHGDFATYEERPELSLVYITRADPSGTHAGAWRLASVARVLASLRTAKADHESFDLLSRERLPFSYAEGEAPRLFKVIDTRPDGNLGLRFYLPSLRRGCIAAYGEVPERVAAALEAVERAADAVGEVVPTQQGSLLVASNWFALHGRTRQTISSRRPNREALLCFLARILPVVSLAFVSSFR